MAKDKRFKKPSKGDRRLKEYSKRDIAYLYGSVKYQKIYLKQMAKDLKISRLRLLGIITGSRKEVKEEEKRDICDYLNIDRNRAFPD